MRAHLEGCPACAEDHDSLRALVARGLDVRPTAARDAKGWTRSPRTRSASCPSTTVAGRPAAAVRVPSFGDRLRADPAFQAFTLLRVAFTVAPILFGLDKFFNVMVDWPIYLAPWINDIVPGSGADAMHMVGVIEIAAGLAVAVKPRYGAYLVAAWLAGIIVNLLTLSALLRRRAARLRPAARRADARPAREQVRRAAGYLGQPLLERHTAWVAREPGLLDQLRRICGDEHVVSEQTSLRTYESDGLTQYAVRPRAAVLPGSAEQVQEVVRLCHRLELPWVARGAGTGLSAGALPVADGVLIVLARLRRVLEVDLDNRCLVVEPGVTNVDVGNAAGDGFLYPPDPSSQIVCSIGGNVAENAGGPRCFKYGFTTNYVIGLEVVLSDGELVRLGGKEVDRPGYDLLGAFVGSEGTLGIATKIWVRIVPAPEAVATMVGVLPLDRGRGQRGLGDRRLRGGARGDRADGPADARGDRRDRQPRLSRGRRGGADRRARRPAREL